MVRVLVFGGRNYADRRKVYEVLDRLHAQTPIDVIIEGEATGADTLAREWAESRGVSVEPYPADWGNVSRPGAVVRRNRSGKLYDAAAGSLRNEKMLRIGKPDRAIGFPGGRGTLDMARKCVEHGLVPDLI